MTLIIAYTPFLDPIRELQTWWFFLLLPLAFGISMIYKAMRCENLKTYWHNVFVMTAQIVAAMIALAVGLIFIVLVLIPLIPVR